MTKRILFALTLLFSISAAGAQDWANIKKYEEANSKVQPPSENEKQVVFHLLATYCNYPFISPPWSN